MTFFSSSPSPPLKLKSFKKDIAPTGFFFDIISSKLFKIPIAPVPLRIDKLTNGEPTLIVLPNTEYLERLFNDYKVNINYKLLYSIGLNNLITYAKEKYKEITKKTLQLKKIREWWNSSKNISSNCIDLKESFTYLYSQFIKVFSIITQNNLNDVESTNILIEYCDKIIQYFRFKIEENIFRIRHENHIKEEKLYIEKKNKCYPLVLKIEVLDRSNNKIYTRDFVPYLIYDDILNCFSYNRSILKKELKGKMINLKLYQNFNILNNISKYDEGKTYQQHLDIDFLRTLKLNEILKVYEDLRI